MVCAECAVCRRVAAIMHKLGRAIYARMRLCIAAGNDGIGNKSVVRHSLKPNTFFAAFAIRKPYAGSANKILWFLLAMEFA